MSKIVQYIKAVSPITFISSILSAFIGASIVYYMYHHIDIVRLLIVLTCLVLIHSGINLYNDYRDYVTGIDLMYRRYRTVHRMNIIIDLNVNPIRVRNISILLISLGVLLGCSLLLSLSIIEVLVVVGLGLLVGVGYSSPKLKLRYRGLGEIFAGITTGSLISCGTFIVLSQSLNMYGILLSSIAGLVNGLYTTLILTELAIARYEIDRMLGKKTIVAVVGLRNIKYFIETILVICYIIPIVLYVLNIVSIYGILSILALPLTITYLRSRKPFNLFIARSIMSIFICLGFIIH